MEHLRLSALLAAGAALGACASTPAPVAELAAARAAVARAQPEGARHAPAQLLAAQRKLVAAQAAMDAERYDRARRLSVEAEADALLVAAKSESARAEVALDEVRESNRTLRTELQRSAR